jgi:phosphoribosylformimino-5-aminoimidazole carboxamide ribotide isomerase
LHLVDLDGAKAGHIVNHKVLEQVATKTGLVVDFGGGLKSDKDLEIAFNAGAAMVTGGSIAVKNREAFLVWHEKYGSEKIILGADAKNGMIAISGWLEKTELPVVDFISAYFEKGIRKVISTDISRDGMLTGPAFDLYADIMKALPGVEIIASGGISSMDDILKLNEMGVPGVIVGKAIYEARITMNELEDFQSAQ